ncbi:MAG: fucose isomerase, partial [Pedobacter sp.]
MKQGVLKQIVLVSSGDLRLSANQNCWAAQLQMEANLTTAIEKFGWTVKRAHPYNSTKKHGFIDSQRMGMDVFHDIDPNQPLIV